MNCTKTEEKLIDAMARMDIIDCHEHLPPEDVRTSTPQDVFTLFSHYTMHDLISAGMDPKDHESLFHYDVPLERRWAKLAPYWQAIRYGSYARAALIAAKEVYGIADINEKTYQELSDRIAAENTPGIYRRILCDRCRIRASLTQGAMTGLDYPLVPVGRGFSLHQLLEFQDIENLTRITGGEVPRTLDQYLVLCRKILEKWNSDGAVGIKLKSLHNVLADRRAAEQAFGNLLDRGNLKQDQLGFEVLQNFLIHEIIDMAAELDLVISVHAGIWGDFRTMDPKFMLTLAPAHPQATFDLYHLGMPFVRDAIVVGKNLPNVYLNLCWTHIISQAQTRSGIDELLDQVPLNKILAFGGDYRRPVEKVVGHLHMARENFAEVFGRRIDRGLMSFDQAVAILKQWFWDNPLRLYSRLQVK